MESVRDGLDVVGHGGDGGGEGGHKVLVGDVGDGGFWEGVKKEVSLFRASHFCFSSFFFSVLLYISVSNFKFNSQDIFSFGSGIIQGGSSILLNRGAIQGRKRSKLSTYYITPSITKRGRGGEKEK